MTINLSSLGMYTGLHTILICFIYLCATVNVYYKLKETVQIGKEYSSIRCMCHFITKYWECFFIYC